MGALFGGSPESYAGFGSLQMAMPNVQGFV
jgi:hypothetical protein